MMNNCTIHYLNSEVMYGRYCIGQAGFDGIVGAPDCDSDACDVLWSGLLGNVGAVLGASRHADDFCGIQLFGHQDTGQQK